MTFYCPKYHCSMSSPSTCLARRRNNYFTASFKQTGGIPMERYPGCGKCEFAAKDPLEHQGKLPRLRASS